MDDSILKNSLGQLGGLGKQLGKSVLEEPKKTVQATVKQTGLEQVDDKGAKKIETEQGQAAVRVLEEQKKQDNQDVIKSLYAPSSRIGKQTIQQQQIQKIAEEHPEKTPEELQKMQQLKQRLHEETYYDPTFNPQTKQQEEQVEEQKEKQEEEQKKMTELQEKKGKNEDKKIALQRSQTKIEANRGVSG